MLSPEEIFWVIISILLVIALFRKRKKYFDDKNLNIKKIKVRV